MEPGNKASDNYLRLTTGLAHTHDKNVNPRGYVDQMLYTVWYHSIKGQRWLKFSVKMLTSCVVAFPPET